MKKKMTPQKALRLAGRGVTGTISAFFRIIICIIFFFPFYWMMVTAFKTNLEAMQYPPTLWPETWTLYGFETVFEQIDMWQYIKNSLIVVVVNTVLMTLIMVPAAYAFAKYNFKCKNLLWILLMVSFMVPGCVTFMSVYRMFAQTTMPNGKSMLDSLWPQILPCICNTWGIFLLRQNFMQVPEELIESARLDEANEFQVITKIMLPMAKAQIVTLMLLSVMGTWNAYFWPLMMTVHDEWRPLPVAIELLKSLGDGVEWPIIMAGNFILVAPVLIAFLIASKQIISSMAYRGVK